MRNLTFEKVWSELNDILREGDVIYTLTRNRKNEIDKITPEGFWVITERSRPKSNLIPKWMFKEAIEHLIAQGELTNDKLLNELNVKRSSFVLASLAKLSSIGFDLNPLKVFLKGWRPVGRS